MSSSTWLFLSAGDEGITAAILCDTIDLPIDVRLPRTCEPAVAGWDSARYTYPLRGERLFIVPGGDAPPSPFCLWPGTRR
jgi:hypothetical protein